MFLYVIYLFVDPHKFLPRLFWWDGLDMGNRIQSQVFFFTFFTEHETYGDMIHLLPSSLLGDTLKTMWDHHPVEIQTGQPPTGTATPSRSDRVNLPSPSVSLGKIIAILYRCRVKYLCVISHVYIYNIYIYIYIYV